MASEKLISIPMSAAKTLLTCISVHGEGKTDARAKNELIEAMRKDAGTPPAQPDLLEAGK